MWPDTAPSGWRASTLGEVAQYINGFPFKPHQWKDHGLPIIRIAQMHDSEASCDYFPGDLPAHVKIANGDLLFSWSATLMALIWNRGPAYLNQHIFKVIPASGHDLLFTHHLLNYCLDGLAGQSHGTTMKHVKRSDLLPFKVFTPPLPEQCRIAEILDTLDEAIRKADQVITKLQKMKQGLLQELLTRGIDENGELRDPERHPEQFKNSPLGRIPKDWRPKQLGEVASIIDPNPSHRYPNEVAEGVPIASTENFVGEDDFDLSSATLVPWLVFWQQQNKCGYTDQDVIFARKGRIGFARRYGSDNKVFSHTVVVMKPRGGTDSSFLLWLVRSRLFFSGIRKRMNSNSGVPTLGVDFLGKVPVPQPSLAEQKRIAMALDGLQLKLTAESLELNKLQLLKNGLMDDLLTGRVRVTVEREVAAA